MQITITQITKPVWKAGILHDTFRGDGWHGDCNCCLYRGCKMQTTGVTVWGVGRRGFALASMPLDWQPKVGDTITIHPSQL